MKSNVWRYEQRGPAGWALVLVDYSGALAIFSDWGNYTCKWNAFGPCFLTFLAGMPADVLSDRVCPARSVDHEQTAAAVREFLRAHGAESMSDEQIEYEQELVDGELLAGDNDGHHRWLRDTRIPLADTMVVYGPNRQAVAMSRKLCSWRRSPGSATETS